MTVRQIRGEHVSITDRPSGRGETNAEVEAYVEMDGARAAGSCRPGPDGRRRLTFAGVGGRRRAVAGILAAMGVARGDVVCLLLPSSIDYAVCYQAAARLGAITTGVNLRLARPSRPRSRPAPGPR